jgi:hypothetical protein
VDRTFLTGRFRLTLLLAVSIDADSRNVILAWAVVESENSSLWEYFAFFKGVYQSLQVNAVCLSQTTTKVLLRLMLCLAKTAFKLTVVSTLEVF